MFLAPIGADSPIYHFPWGTIGLIALNVLVLAASTLGLLPPVAELASDYALQHDGLHPLQWITSNFLHEGWAHLVGNMLFLWPFGLIVEGKLGWRRFLPLYLGLGALECLLEQVCLPGAGASLGASSIIFGLMAIACVWAPRNDIEIAYGIWAPFFVRVDTFDLPVLWLSLLMIAKEAAIAAWLQFPVGSELFHLVGAALGAGVGLSLLASKGVDCEGWDLISLLRGQTRDRAIRLHTDARVIDGRSSELDALTRDNEQKKRVGRKVRALTRIHGHLTAEQPTLAWDELQRTRHVLDGFQLGQRDLTRIAQALVDAERWVEAIAAYEELVDRFPADADLGRLILAEILIARQHRPAAALKQLKAIRQDQLPPDPMQRFEKLLRQAEQLLDSGVVEMEGHAWGTL